MSWLDEWVEEDRPDLDELVARQDHFAAPRKPFDPPATIEVHPLAEPRYWRRRDGDSGGGDHITPLKWPGKPYNCLIDMTAEEVALEDVCRQIRWLRARKEHTRAKAIRELAEFRAELYVTAPHMLRAAIWVDEQMWAYLRHRDIVRELELWVQQRKKRQRAHHVSQEERERVVRLYLEIRPTAKSAREAEKLVSAETGIPRASIRRWVDQFADRIHESPTSKEEVEQDMTAKALEHIDNRFDRLEQQLSEDVHDIFRAIAAFRETTPEEWARHLEYTLTTKETSLPTSATTVTPGSSPVRSSPAWWRRLGSLRRTNERQKRRPRR